MMPFHSDQDFTTTQHILNRMTLEPADNWDTLSNDEPRSAAWLPRISCTQWVQHPIGVKEVKGSNPTWDSDFPATCLPRSIYIVSNDLCQSELLFNSIYKPLNIL